LKKVELLLSCGFACSFIGLLASIVLEGLELGANECHSSGDVLRVHALSSASSAAKWALRSWDTLFRRARSFTPTSSGSRAARQLVDGRRLRMLAAGRPTRFLGPDEAQNRAAGILSMQVQAQAYTLAVRTDSL